MLDNWLFIGVFLLLAAAFPSAQILIQSVIFGTK
jgi:hypothetical protein